MNAHPPMPDRIALTTFLGAIFCHADPGTWIALRAYPDNGRQEPACIVDGARIGDPRIGDWTFNRAKQAAQWPMPAVFCPPTSTFTDQKKADQAHLANGVALSVECDSDPAKARHDLTTLLGEPTVTVASGGVWTDPTTGKMHDKVHLHWRLTEPTREEADHARLKRARRLACAFVGADATAISLVHPLRWPGSVHRKGTPKLARILAQSEHELELGEALEILEAACPTEPERKPGKLWSTLHQGAEGDALAADLLDVAAALAAIPNENLEWADWNRIGMAAWRATEGRGFAAFDAWSQKSPKYDAQATAGRWEHYSTSPPERIGAGTLFALAAEAVPGWRRPTLLMRDAQRGSGEKAGPEKPDDDGPGEAEDDGFKPKPPPSDLDDLNAEFCVVLDTGRARVLHFETVRQEKHSREVACFLSFEDFRNFHMNRFVEVKSKDVPLGQWWLRHPGRRQYRGLTFEPAAEREINGRLNLWRGWGVQPAPGDWSLMKRHIVDVLAAGDLKHAAYITKWIAWAVQHPAERAQAALVFKGARGTGKGTLGNALCRIFGQHGTHISTAEHLAGRFNGHLRDACFLFADEAYWPGDKGAEGSLKRLVTEPDLFIEAKGKDGVTVPNMLHVMMASNDDWVVPAGEDERRYAVFAVSDCRKQDEAWFGPLNAQMDAGGYGAMLHDLLRHDLGDWHPRRIPRTEALVEQQSRGLGPEDAWWCELLQTGVLWGSNPRRPDTAVSNAWEEEKEAFSGARMVKRKGLYDQAREMSPRLKGYSDHMLGRVLTEHGCSNEHKVMRRRGWHFPSLKAARTAWEIRFPGWKWRLPELNDWHREAED